MRNHLRTIAACVLLLAGACGGGGDSKESATTKGVAGDRTTTSAPAGASTDAGGDPTTTAAASPGSTAKGKATTTTAGAASGSGGTGDSGPTANSGGGEPAAVGAKPGTYVYEISGNRSGGTPPTTSQVNGQSKLVVDPASGTEQHSTQSDASGASGGSTELLLRFAADGVRLVNFKITGQLSKEFKPDPPVLAYPQPSTNGKQWSWDMTSTDGTTTIHADYRISGTEAVTIGGQSVDCVKVESTTVIKTSYNGAPITVTQTQTRWQSEAHKLALKTHDITDVGAFGKADTTQTLTSLTPA